MFGVFRHRAFRWIWIGALVSNVGNWMEAVAQSWLVQQQTGSPFMVELREVEVFDVSKVIHLSVGQGWDRALRIHQILQQGNLECKEFFEYHPHVTLAQDIDPAKVNEVAELAARRWKEYSGRRDFLVDHVTLVQNTVENRWTNLGEFTLRVPVSV